VAVGYVIDWLLGGQRSAAGLAASSYELRQWVPWAIVGLIAWTWSWRSVVGRRRADPVAEAQSTIRRAFLYLTIAVSLVAALAAAALILYRLVGILLNAGLGGNLASELSTPLGSLAIAVLILAYHGLRLRADLTLAETAERADLAEGATAVDASATAQAGAPGDDVGVASAEGRPLVRRRMELVGPPDADLDAALSAVRTALPPGVELVVSEG